MNIDQLKKIVPYAGAKAGIFLAPLNESMARHEINTPVRQAAFIAQIAHESGSFRYVKELASGAAYEGRHDLGNTEPGDGVRFKGRGLIQITGRANYRECSIALFGDPDILIAHPEMLETVSCACDSAGWFWSSHGLNELADAGRFERITRCINGGLNGQAERLAFYATAKEVLE
jgi:putative chitinase